MNLVKDVVDPSASLTRPGASRGEHDIKRSEPGIELVRLGQLIRSIYCFPESPF